MTAPSVQLFTNSYAMMVYCDFYSFLSNYIAYNLYYSTSSTMVGEAVVGRFPNIVDTMYSKRSVMIPFSRPVSESTEFYLRLKGVFSSGSEDSSNPGSTKFIAAVSESLPLNKPVIIQGYDGNVYRPVQVNSAGKLVTTT